MIKALERLGLTRVEAEVYVYTAKNGPQTSPEFGEALDYSKKKVNASLRTLIKEALVTKEGNNFHEIPFEEALELLIEREKQQAHYVQEKKKELFANWSKEK